MERRLSDLPPNKNFRTAFNSYDLVNNLVNVLKPSSMFIYVPYTE